MKHWWMYNHHIELAVNYLRQILVTSGPLTVWGKKENVSYKIFSIESFLQMNINSG